MSSEDYYKLLGVSRGATDQEIRRAYRKLAKDLHPDRNPGNASAEARFKMVSNAYETLSDPEKRRLYDQYGEASTSSGFQEGFFRGAPGGGGFGDMFGGGGDGGFGFSFDDLFSGRSIQDMFQRRAPKPQKSPDVEAEVAIDFVDAIRGCQRDFKLSFGHHDKALKIRIPQGIGDGEKLRLRGQGQPPNGDLVLTVRVRPHECFQRRASHLLLDVPLTPLEAFRGAQVRLPTADGFVTLKIPPRTEALSKLRIRGKGVVRKNKEPGDLIVRVVIVSPPWPEEGEEAETAKSLEQLETLFVGDVRAELRF